MRILLIGKGSREHALAWKLARSPLLKTLLVWPGHAGMARHGERLDVAATASMPEVARAAKAAQVDLVVVGPEGPLEQGLADELAKVGVPCFGPSQSAARLESSKEFAKVVMKKAGIPTAAFELARSEAECREVALAMLARTGGTVLKASGLAAGKGVFVCTTAAEVEVGLRHLYHSDMRTAAATVVVEETLKGREFSYFSFIGEGGATGLGSAVDHKRLNDGDKGPNTGGMGSYAPVPWLPSGAVAEVERRVVEPLLAELKKDGIDYRGCLYVGLMWGEGGASVVEFNVRLGDPEAQILAVQDDRDWLALIAKKCGLGGTDLPAPGREKATVGIVMASAGYPFGEGEKPGVVLPEDIFAHGTEDLQVFAASIEGDTLPVKSGKGRVLTVVARAKDFNAARRAAYARVEEIARVWPGARFRRDIALAVEGSAPHAVG